MGRVRKRDWLALTFVSLFLSGLRNAFCQIDDQPSPVSGYVTAVASRSSFTVGGVAVSVGPKVIYAMRDGRATTSDVPAYAVYVGEYARVDGVLNKKSRSIVATRLTIDRSQVTGVKGKGIVEVVEEESGGAGRVVRADGYRLRLTAKTKLSYLAPLTGPTDIATNTWIEYEGMEGRDGSVLVGVATFRKNLVDHSENHLREKNEFDASAVTGEEKQGFLSKGFLGRDLKRIPALQLPEVQARVERIGRSLIPAYQRQLPASDPTHIDFRFQLVDLPGVRHALTLPSGIILVPAEVVERLTTDAQIATILASSIAEAIEKDEFRLRPTRHRAQAAELAGLGAGVFVPGLALATDLGGGGVVLHELKMMEQQQDRVSLYLLKDAGYDPAQAPVAWWLLEPKKAKPVEEIALPARSAYLYQRLGTAFRVDAGEDAGDPGTPHP